jgi:tRNA(fMet)-specific endonuclease VapC
MKYALDTNTLIRYLRKAPIVRSRLHDAAHDGHELIIPKTVDYEVRRGFRIMSAPAKEAAYKVLTGVSGYCEIEAMDNRSWVRAERVYAGLYKKSLTIGEIDILIAAFCLEHGCTLVTNNTKDFGRVEGLRLEDWSQE